MTWCPTARIARPYGCATAKLRGLALQPPIVWPDSNINGGADYSVDFSDILGCGETVLSFDFDPGAAGSIAWLSSYGSCVTAYITWLSAGTFPVTVAVRSSYGNTCQVTVSITVSNTPALLPSIPQPGPGPIKPVVDSNGMEGWLACLGTRYPTGDGWWNNAGIPVFAGRPDLGDPSLPGLIINDDGMTDWMGGLPLTPPPSSGWWNNAGIPAFFGTPRRRQTPINSAQMSAWLALLPLAAPVAGWWNNANIPTLQGPIQ